MQSPISRRVFATGSAGVAAAAFIGSRAASAQEASPVPASPAAQALPPLPEGAVVVAHGLWNPTGLVFGPDGTLYIAEQGVVTGTTDEPSPGTSTNLKDNSPVKVPVPGQITAVTPDGSATVLATGILGATSLAWGNDLIYVVAGGESIGAGFKELAGENRLSSVDPKSGEVKDVADFGAYEVANNPDGTDINPNLYGVAVDGDGAVFVADAGGNTIYKVDASTGKFDVFAVVPNQETLLGASPVPVEQSRQPVPTSLVFDADGVLHVSLLSLVWQGPSILLYTPDGEYTAGPGPLDTIVNITIGPDGKTYVTQLATDFESANPGLGAIYRVNDDGTTEAVVKGLFFPHGIAFDDDGTLYVTVNSIVSGPGIPAGQVVKFEGIAAAS